jgi:hypothetical protein
MYEWHESNPRGCAEILIKLSHISLTPNMAQPVLELLSNLTEMPKLFNSKFFTDKEFIAVAATAIKCIDPVK